VDEDNIEIDQLEPGHVVPWMPTRRLIVLGRSLEEAHAQPDAVTGLRPDGPPGRGLPDAYASNPADAQGRDHSVYGSGPLLILADRDAFRASLPAGTNMGPGTLCAGLVPARSSTTRIRAGRASGSGCPSMPCTPRRSHVQL
jgi:hypothetical protein